MKRVLQIVLILVIVAVAVPAVLYGTSFWNERMRIQDAAPAFAPLEELGCVVKPSPNGTRYCRYSLQVSPESKVTDETIKAFESLNKLPAKNTLDVVIWTKQVTDESVDVLKTIKAIDFLDVNDSGISNDGIATLKKEMSGTYVNSR